MTTSSNMAAIEMLLENVVSVMAYIGPGLGLGAIAVVLAVLLSILLAVFALVWYPLKSLFRKKSNSETDESRNDSEANQAETEN